MANTPNTPDALKAYQSKKVLKLFKETKVLSETEIHAHYDVMVENYIKKVQIESRTIAELCYNYILPAAFEYQSVLAQNIERMKNIGVPATGYQSQMELVTHIADYTTQIGKLVVKMTEERKVANNIEHVEKRANQYCFKILPMVDEIRRYVDKLEYIIDDKKWPLVKYREMLFLR